MTDLQARAEAAADATGADRGGLAWKWARDGAAHALQSEGWRPGDRAVCSVDGHEHEVTILGKHETHWTVDFGAFKAHVVEHRLRLPTPPEGETP